MAVHMLFGGWHGREDEASLTRSGSEDIDGLRERTESEASGSWLLVVQMDRRTGELAG